MKKILLSLIIISSYTLSAQTNNYKWIDDAVAKFGALSTSNVATIAYTITRNFNSNEQKARAIFYWIASNIAIDAVATKKKEDKRNKDHLQLRRRNS